MISCNWNFTPMSSCLRVYLCSSLDYYFIQVCRIRDCDYLWIVSWTSSSPSSPEKDNITKGCVRVDLRFESKGQEANKKKSVCMSSWSSIRMIPTVLCYLYIPTAAASSIRGVGGVVVELCLINKFCTLSNIIIIIIDKVLWYWWWLCVRALKNPEWEPGFKFIIHHWQWLSGLSFRIILTKGIPMNLVTREITSTHTRIIDKYIANEIIIIVCSGISD